MDCYLGTPLLVLEEKNVTIAWEPTVFASTRDQIITLLLRFSCAVDELADDDIERLVYLHRRSHLISLCTAAAFSTWAGAC
jgi:hypothetical protein